jgi:hypothetical protein
MKILLEEQQDLILGVWYPHAIPVGCFYTKLLKVNFNIAITIGARKDNDAGFHSLMAFTE